MIHPTPEHEEKAVLLVQSGNEFHVAARVIGVSAETFDQWMIEGKNRLVDGEGDEDALVSFYRAVDKARATAEANLVSKVQQAASNGSWQAAAWLLERGFTGWQRLTAEQRNSSGRQEPDELDPFSELDNVTRIRPHGHAPNTG